MSLTPVTKPPILNETGEAIVTKLEAIKNAVQPTNPCTDIDISIPASGWSSSSPYQYTYTNSHITAGCEVKVGYLEGAESCSVLYLEYEKVTNGVRFTAPTKPSVAIPVRIHILAADASSVVATTADQVSTNVISGQSNVEGALGSLADHIAALETPLSRLFTGIGISDYGDYIYIPMDTNCLNKYKNASLSDLSYVIIPNVQNITSNITGISARANGIYLACNLTGFSSYYGKAFDVEFKVI